MNLTTTDLKHYRLIDSGEGLKLEDIAGVVVSRPSPQAIWKKRLSLEEWSRAKSVCVRQKDGGGTWQHHTPPPKELWLPFEDMKFRLKFTSFGHCGLFFEQVGVWKWLSDEVKRVKESLGRAPKVVNLFGYTGAASIVMAKAGAEVYHVDSSKGVLEWGAESAKASKADVRWIHEDAQRFLINSYNKQLRFDGMLADPPSWGHGAKKEVWDFEKHVAGLLDKMHATLNKKNAFVFLSSHTHGVQQEALKNVLAQDGRWKDLMSGELGVKHEKDERILPAGIYAAGRC